jgi:CheY-like chemotaxis protein
MSEAKRVLVIDDDVDFLEFCKAALEIGGYAVSLAECGKDGRDAAVADPPDLILVDMMMETWSEGSNVVEFLRKTPQTKKIPIILLSAVDMMNSVTEGVPEDALDVNAYMVKPIDPKKLLEQVGQLLK